MQHKLIELFPTVLQKNTVSRAGKGADSTDLITALSSAMPMDQLINELPQLLSNHFQDGSLEDAKIIVDRLVWIDFDRCSSQSRIKDTFYHLSQDDVFKGLRYMRVAPNFIKQFATMESLYQHVFENEGMTPYYKSKMREMLTAGHKGLPYTIRLRFADESMEITRKDYHAFCSIFSLQNLYTFMMKGLDSITVLPDKEGWNGNVYYTKVREGFGGKFNIDVAIRNVYYQFGGSGRSTDPHDVYCVLIESIGLRPSRPIKVLDQNMLSYSSALLDVDMVRKALHELAGAADPSIRKMAAAAWLTSPDDLAALARDSYSGTASFAVATKRIPAEIKALYLSCAEELCSALFSDRYDRKMMSSFVGTYVFLNILFSLVYHERGRGAEQGTELAQYVRRHIMRTLRGYAESADLEGFKKELIRMINTRLPDAYHGAMEWTRLFGHGDFDKQNGAERYMLLHYSFDLLCDRMEDISSSFELFHTDYLRWEAEYHEYIINRMRKEADRFWQYVYKDDIWDLPGWLAAGEEFYRECSRTYGEALFSEVFGPDYLNRFKERAYREAEATAEGFRRMFEEFFGREGDARGRSESVPSSVPLEEALALFGYADTKELDHASIRSRYGRLSMKFHPDKHQQEIKDDPAVGVYYKDKQIELSEARAVLEAYVSGR